MDINPHGVMAIVMNCNFKLSKFELQACYCIHCQANTLGNGMNLLIPPTLG